MVNLLLRIGAVLLLCVPLSFIVTLLATPLWSWIEASYGIESVGHSGPAQWSYVVVYVVMNLLVLARLWYRWDRAKKR